MVRKKISRVWQNVIGNGKEALGDRNESDVSIDEAREYFARAPPFITFNAFPEDQENDRIGPLSATPGQASAYLEAFDENGSVQEQAFMVPHYQKRRGRKRLQHHNSWGPQEYTTGDARFKITATVDLPRDVETTYGDVIPEGEYRLRATTDKMSDEEIDAVLGNIDDRTAAIEIQTDQLARFLQGQKANLDAIDNTIDPDLKKFLQTSNEVLTDDIVKNGDGHDIAAFAQDHTNEGYPDKWSGLVYENDRDYFTISHLSTPGPRDREEGSRPVIAGEVEVNYDEALEELEY